jgi:hypothetical protein
MKKTLTFVLTVVLALSTLSAQAHPGGGHWGGGERWGGGHWGAGWGRGAYVAPILAAGVVGASIYAASNPYYYATPVTPGVVVAPVAQPVYSAPQAPVGYYCASYQQYYPQVQTCPVPWQLVQ